MVLIDIKNVTISYRNVAAVSNLSLTVAKGEYFCITGRNGAGKTTLLKAILGLVPVTSGSIDLAVGKERIGYMPQVRTIPPDFPATAREVILAGRQGITGGSLFYGKADRNAADAAISRLGITAFAAKRIGELSGGEQQRVLLARALCRRPELLILDEPCAGLDAAITAEFYELTGELNRDGGITIVIVAHDLPAIKNLATRFTVLE